MKGHLSRKMLLSKEPSAVKNTDAIKLYHFLEDFQQYEGSPCCKMMQSPPYLVTKAAYTLVRELETMDWDDDAELYMQYFKIDGEDGAGYSLTADDSGWDDDMDLDSSVLECEGGEELAVEIMARLNLYYVQYTRLHADDKRYDTNTFTLKLLKSILPTPANRLRYKLSLLID